MSLSKREARCDQGVGEVSHVTTDNIRSVYTDDSNITIAFVSFSSYCACRV